MNYLKHYQTLIERARSRILPKETYVEIHHVIPRCLGGDDSPENLVALTPEEHVVAHLLLIKLHPDNPKLLYAIQLIYGSNVTDGTIVKNNKEYGWVRRKVIADNSERMKGNTFSVGSVRSDETKAKISAALTGRQLSDETKMKMSESRTGLLHSDSAKEKMSKAKKGKQPRGVGFSLSDDTKKKISLANKGKAKSADHLKKLNEARDLAAKKRKENNIASPMKGKPWSEARRIAAQKKKDK